MKTIDVVAGVIWHNGCFLSTQRVRGSHVGWWEFPGGKVNQGESRINALARELHEELGLSIESADLWRTITHETEDQCINLHVYHIIRFSGEPQPREGQGMRWLTPREACDMQFLEVDMPLVRELAGHVAQPLPDMAAFGWLNQSLLDASPAV